MPPISQTASGSTAVLKYRPTETLRLLGARLLDSARLCRRRRPARPPKWRKTGVYPGAEAKSGERRTVCWRRESAANSCLETPILLQRRVLGRFRGIRAVFRARLAHLVTLYPAAKSNAYEFLHPTRARVRACDRRRARYSNPGGTNFDEAIPEGSAYRPQRLGMFRTKGRKYDNFA